MRSVDKTREAYRGPLIDLETRRTSARCRLIHWVSHLTGKQSELASILGSEGWRDSPNLEARAERLTKEIQSLSDEVDIAQEMFNDFESRLQTLEQQQAFLLAGEA